MFRFQRRTDLALAALRRLGEAEDRRLSGTALAREVGTTASFLPQIMSPLIRAGWVVSERGPGGGYTLTDDSDSISLLDVVETTEGPTVDGRCALRDAPCPGDVPCPVHHVAVAAREVLRNGFSQIPAISQAEGSQ